MSETNQRARDMPQRWKWVTFPDRTSAMTTEPDGEWCKVEDVAAALEQAQREGERAMQLYCEELKSDRAEAYREGVEAMRDLAIRDCAGSRRVEEWLTELSARLLSEGGERRCILCKVPLVVGPPTCPDCGGHAWKEEK